jgi:hypothetical protein
MQLLFMRITNDGTNRKLWLSQASGTGLSADTAEMIFYNAGGVPIQVSIYH